MTDKKMPAQIKILKTCKKGHKFYNNSKAAGCTRKLWPNF